jgi:predicted RNA-binding Zn-ribbon protein involved in translation (DUF1610 family)
MRANRKVVENTCSICGRGFSLGDEVYSCPQCGGFHHAPCWDSRHSCAPAERAADEKNCPSCGQIIKQEALKCRHCGAVLNAELVSRIEPATIPPEVVQNVNKLANRSLTLSIIGLFICGPILGGFAIAKANEAFKTLKEFPDAAELISARRKTKAGAIIGWSAAVLWLLSMIGRFAGS